MGLKAFGASRSEIAFCAAAGFAGAILLVVTAVPFLFAASLSTTWLALLLVGRGAGLALAQMPATTAAYASVSAEQIGDATTLVNIIQRVGGAIGAASVIIALAQFGGSSSPNAYLWTFGLLVVISILTLIPAAILQRQASARRAAGH